MASILKSTRNTRSILPASLRFIRSDVPNCITEEEIQFLLENKVTTIIDLREDDERIHKKCPLIDHVSFQYYCMPVTGGNFIPASTDAVSESYIRMVDIQMKKIIDTIWNAKTNVLYFCNAGKDRTGVVSAILLYKLGMTKEYIIADYMQSKDNLKDVLEAYVKQESKIDVAVITPHEKYMKEFLDWLRCQMTEKIVRHYLNDICCCDSDDLNKRD